MYLAGVKVGSEGEGGLCFPFDFDFCRLRSSCPFLCQY